MKYLLLPVLLLCMPLYAQKQFTVYFDFDIAETSAASADKLSGWIERNNTAVIQQIDGYADKTGDSLYNIDLSERRADYVFKRLQQSGINAANADIRGFGESMSVAVHSPKDRKVTITYAMPEPVRAEAPKKTEPSELSKKVTNGKKGDRIRVPGLNFYNDSDIVLPKSREVLADLLKIVQDNPKLKIDIQGHICCRKNEVNQISLKRAVAVYTYLVNNGIDKSRLSYQGFGSSKPVYALPEKSEEEKITNRRVEIEILEM